MVAGCGTQLKSGIFKFLYWAPESRHGFSEWFYPFHVASVVVRTEMNDNSSHLCEQNKMRANCDLVGKPSANMAGLKAG